MTKKAWGGRFRKDLNSIASKFNASLSFDYILYKYDIDGSKAHAQMLAKQKLITDEEAESICKGLEEIKDEMPQFELDDKYEDIHMFIEHLLCEKIGNVGKKLHTGRSRNDQNALDMRLYLRDKTDEILKILSNLNKILNSFSIKHQNIEMPGYTHLQQAQPIKLGQYFAAYESMIIRDYNRFLDCRNRMNYSPLGAGALAGSTLPLDREWVAKKLNFNGTIENTLDAVSDRDFVMEFCCAASILFVHLSRLCEDMIIWNSQEFNFIEIDDAFATGSSLMPNKKNPDIFELIRGKSGRIFGNLMSILTVMKGLPMAYNKDMQEDKESLFDTVKTTISCLEIIPMILDNISFNIDKMKNYSSFLNATKMLEELVANGMPFRDAHHQVGEWVKIATSNNKTLHEVFNEMFIAKSK